MHTKFQSDGLMDRLLRNRRVDGMTILKFILRRRALGDRLNSSDSLQVTGVRSCEQGNET
jgi:hypothetical protein